MFYTLKYRTLTDFGEEVVPWADGDNIPNGKQYFARMAKQELLDDAPIFDSFFLHTTHREEEKWDWMVQDAHRLEVNQEETVTGWLVSDYFKRVLEHFIIAEPYRFYPAKLKHKNNKLDYHILHLLWMDRDKEFDIPKCRFREIDGITKEPTGNIVDSFYDKRAYDEAKLVALKSKKKLVPDSMVIRKYYDFVPLFGFTADIIITERLKLAIEQAKIEGMEIGEVPYEIVMPGISQK